MKPTLFHLILLLFVFLPTSQAQGALIPHLCGYHQESSRSAGIDCGIRSVLAGTSISPPRTANQLGEIVLNTHPALPPGDRLSGGLMQEARFTPLKKPRILYVNSYDKGFSWSDDIEAGLFITSR